NAYELIAPAESYTMPLREMEARAQFTTLRPMSEPRINGQRSPPESEPHAEAQAHPRARHPRRHRDEERWRTHARIDLGKAPGQGGQRGPGGARAEPACPFAPPFGFWCLGFWRSPSRWGRSARAGVERRSGLSRPTPTWRSMMAGETRPPSY